MALKTDAGYSGLQPKKQSSGEDNANRIGFVGKGVTTAKRYRNTEIYTVRDGKITEALVFFGWDVPHPAPEGGFIENDGEGHV